MGNETAHRSKKNKNDEFYTFYEDIEKELGAYLSKNKNLFRNKTVLLPCDDPDWSKFTEYFLKNFRRLGLKRLISTCYSKGMNGKKLDVTSGCSTSLSRKVELLDGEGAFDSEEVTALRDEADFIVTNPPFSLYRSFWPWVEEWGKETGGKFILVAPAYLVSYACFNKAMQTRSVWPGINKVNEFARPDGSIALFGSLIGWITNVDHKQHPKPLKLHTKAYNTKNGHSSVKGIGYKKYDGSRVLEVPRSDMIPSDHKGLMGVPITYWWKWCPDQFELLGNAKGSTGHPDVKKAGLKSDTNVVVDGKSLFARLIIRRKK